MRGEIFSLGKEVGRWFTEEFPRQVRQARLSKVVLEDDFTLGSELLLNFALSLHRWILEKLLNDSYGRRLVSVLSMGLVSNIIVMHFPVASLG